MDHSVLALVLSGPFNIQGLSGDQEDKRKVQAVERALEWER